MIKQTIVSLVTLASTILIPVSPVGVILLSPVPEKPAATILAQHSLDLTTREPGAFANEVFSDNILLALHYLQGDVKEGNIDWQEIRQPFEVAFVLRPGEIFAFHANVLPEFAKPTVTMNSYFFIEEGYRSVGGLGGNGVCHLASLINWVAWEARLADGQAGLAVTAKVNHNFAPVPGVPKELGVSIRSQSPTQNLYIQNNFEIPVIFAFMIKDNGVHLTILSKYTKLLKLIFETAIN